MAGECSICDKHQTLSLSTGPVIAEQGGLVLTHFPDMSEETPTRGHLLIEPRRHITDFVEMDADEASALGKLVKFAVERQREVLGAEHVYLFRLNDKVPHLHFHLVPRYPGTPHEFWGLKIKDWPDRPKVRLPEIVEIAEHLRVLTK